MNFVQIGMLGALGALAIPIVIHLMFRRQARPVDLGTLQFLKIVLRDNSRKRKLKRYVLLALRLAGVALIAFLFARPYLLANELVDGSRMVVVLVDRSASMGLKGGTRPIDKAASEARAVVGRAGQGAQLEVATFDTTISPFAKSTDSAKATYEPSSGGTDYGAAMAWARDLLVRGKQKQKELHILTDLQRSGLDRGDSVKLPAGVEVHLSDLGRAFPKNVGVTGLVTSPASLRPRETAVVTASVRNASPLPISKVPVRLHLQAADAPAIDQEKTIDLDGNTTATVAFKLPEMEEGLWKGHVEASAGDDLPFDDRRYLALAVAPPPRLLLIDGDTGRLSIDAETYFLRAALRLATEKETYTKAPFAPKVVDQSEAGSALADLGKTEAVILANAGNLAAAEAQTLAEYVRRGGGLVVFTGDHMTADGAASLTNAGLGAGKIVGPQQATDRPWRLESWESSHPVFRPFADPEHGDLRRPAFLTITKIEPDASARVLARFRGGVPAVIERQVGRGKVLWFASACDRDWGDWPRSRLYLPMVHQLVAYASGLADGGRIRQEIATGDAKPGLHETDGILRVVNVDPFESETARCTPKEFADRFGFTLPDVKPVTATKQTGKAKTDDRLRSDEIWPWLALVLVGVLLLEHFLANRTAA